MHLSSVSGREIVGFSGAIIKPEWLPSSIHLQHHRQPRAFFQAMTTLQIRIASLADTGVIAPLFDAYRQFYEQPADLDRATVFIHERLQKNESVILLAQTQDHQAIGFCQMYPSFCSVEAQPIYALYDLFVLPQARRTGAGRLLLSAAEQHAAQTGAARMDLTTAKTNLSAQRLYESCGWCRDEVFYTYSRRVAR
jgi:ribosomal protein S18 acetylase RimI-like enzyme